MEPNTGYIPLSLLSSFHRIQSMSVDRALLLRAIRSSKLIELDEKESAVRPVDEPEKWPIKDSLSMTTLPLPPQTGVYHNNNSIVNHVGSTTLNPDVPEFVPAAYQAQASATLYTVDEAAFEVPGTEQLDGK